MNFSKLNNDEYKSSLITKLFKNFEEEYYVFLADRLIFFKRITPYHFNIELRNLKNLKNLKELISSFIIDSSDPHLENKINSLILEKKEYILFEHLKDLKSDIRYTNFVLIFINTYYKEVYLYPHFKYTEFIYSKKYDLLHENFRKNPHFTLKIKSIFNFENTFIHLQMNILHLHKTENLNKQNIYDAIFNAKNEYYSINKNNNFNKKLNDSSFLKWAINYIHKKNYLLYPNLLNQKNYKEYICFSYDFMYLTNKNLYIEEIKKITNSWEQHCYRIKNPQLKKDSTQDEKIKLLMKSKKLTKQKLIKLLIDEAYQELLEEENHLNIKNDLIAPVDLNQNEIKEETPLTTLEKPTEN